MTVTVDTGPITVEVTDGVTVGGLQAERDARIAGDAATVASAATDATSKADAAQAAAIAHADSGDATEATARANAVTAEATARVNADALLIPLAQKAAASGVASLDAAGKVPDAQIPAAIAREADLLAALDRIAALEARLGTFSSGAPYPDISVFPSTSLYPLGV